MSGHGIILHHYDYSSFSEKVRLVLGLKNLTWQGVIIPAYAPKPNLTPLTGGYRHTPVLQVGADIYCDTRLITRELDRRFPEPTICPPHLTGFACAIEAWAERDFFWPIARYVSGLNADLTPAMNADRAAMRGKPPPSVERLKALAGESFNLMQTNFPRVDTMLSDGSPFLIAETPTIADFAIYHGFWFMSAMPHDCSGYVRGFPRITAWMDRIKAIGHGTSTTIAPEVALAIAQEAAPETVRPSRPAPHDIALGRQVRIRPEDYATPPVTGTLVYCDRDEIAVRRDDPVVGTVVVHFPRIGYVVRDTERGG